MSKLYRHEKKAAREKFGFINGTLLSDAYVVGTTRNILLEWLSLLILGATLAGISTHGFLRWYFGRSAKRRADSSELDIAETDTYQEAVADAEYEIASAIPLANDIETEIEPETPPDVPTVEADQVVSVIENEMSDGAESDDNVADVDSDDKIENDDENIDDKNIDDKNIADKNTDIESNNVEEK
jgi:hypothetical protein